MFQLPVPVKYSL